MLHHVAALCLSLAAGLAAEPVKLTEGMGMADNIAAGLAAQLPESARWPVTGTLTTTDGTPASHPFTITWETGSTDVHPEGDGTFRALIPPAALSSGVINTPDGHAVALDPFKGGTMRITTNPDAAPARDVDPSTLDRVSTGTIDVFSEDITADQAIAALAELERIRGFTAGAIGIDLGAQPFGIAILADESNSVAFPGRVLIPVTETNWFNPDDSPGAQLARWVTIHEWAETAVVRSGMRYSESPDLRVLGDGIAELASFEYAKTYQPEAAAYRLGQYLDAIERLRSAGTETYNPAEAFKGRSASIAPDGSTDRIGATTAEAAGYAVAFWVMHQAHQTTGADGVREMLRLVEQGERALDTLTAATGAVADAPLSLAEIESDLRALAASL